MKLSFSRILSHHNCCIFATDFERTCVSTDTKEHKCGEALDDKTPREDGFTVEFYLPFVDLMGQSLAASFNAAYEVNKLSTSRRRGIVSLIPKKDGSLPKLQNRRPITLLNVDCKLALKLINNS